MIASILYLALEESRVLAKINSSLFTPSYQDARQNRERLYRNIQVLIRNELHRTSTNFNILIPYFSENIIYFDITKKKDMPNQIYKLSGGKAWDFLIATHFMKNSKP